VFPAMLRPAFADMHDRWSRAVRLSPNPWFPDVESLATAHAQAGRLGVISFATGSTRDKFPDVTRLDPTDLRIRDAEFLCPGVKFYAFWGEPC
jgi:hypothetical protein